MTIKGCGSASPSLLVELYIIHCPLEGSFERSFYLECAEVKKYDRLETEIFQQIRQSIAVCIERSIENYTEASRFRTCHGNWRMAGVRWHYRVS